MRVHRPVNCNCCWPVERTHTPHRIGSSAARRRRPARDSKRPTGGMPAMDQQHQQQQQQRQQRQQQSQHQQRRQQQPAPYCIVTGANTGLGLETTAALMQRGCHVVMGCRDAARCAAAQQELRARRLLGSCECASLDVASRSSVTRFAAQQGEQLQARGQRLSVLVNNAGIMGSNAPAASESSSGSGDSVAPGVADAHLAVNHLGPFLLTTLLLPHMESGSRIVNVSSRAHYMCRDLQLTQGSFQTGPAGWFAQYARSKLCNVLHAAELQSRLQASRGIIATSVSPGFVGTTIFRSLPAMLQWPAQLLAHTFGRTPAQGAEVAAFAATSPALSPDKPVPLFLHDCKPKEPSALAQDKQLAADLWTASCKAVGWTDA